jgi:hypothetical protein
MEGKTENYTPGDDFTPARPRGQNSPLGNNIASWVKVCTFVAQIRSYLAIFNKNLVTLFSTERHTIRY